jgi:hypothetical protein
MTKLGLVFPGADLGADVSGIRDYVQAVEHIRGLVTAEGRDPGAFGNDLIVATAGFRPGNQTGEADGRASSGDR